MRKMVNWLAVSCIVVCLGCLLVAFDMLTKSLKEDVREANKQKEQCIVLKYKNNAQQFLDNECNRYVRWTE